MVVVGHQAVREKAEAVDRRGIRENRQKVKAISIVVVDRASFVPARDDVIDAVLDLEPQWACHGSKLPAPNTDHPPGTRVVTKLAQTATERT